jgi:hypothetical protein
VNSRTAAPSRLTIAGILVAGGDHERTASEFPSFGFTGGVASSDPGLGTNDNNRVKHRITHGFASIPDLSGIWAHLSWPGVERPTYDYTNPILKPAAAEIVKQHGEILKGGASLV